MDNNHYSEDVNEFLVLHQPKGTTNPKVGDSSSSMGLQVQVIWTINQTKIFSDLYKKYKSKVETIHIKNSKKLWETIEQEINKLVNSDLTPNQCENRWRVLERAYKKYIDNQNKTGQDKKYFEYLEEMDEIFKGRRNVKPVLLLSNDIVEMSDEESDNDRCAIPKSFNSLETTKSMKEKSKLEGSMKRKRTPIANRNVTLAGMKKDRREYQDAKLQIEREKLEIQRKKLEAMQERNILLKERNELMEKQNDGFFSN